MTKKTDGIDVPTRRTVETLFRDLLGYGRWSQEAPLWEAYKRLDEESSRMCERLLDVPEYRDLEARKEAALSRHNKVGDRVRDRTRKVQKLYQSRGLTPAVVRQVQELVDWVNGLDKEV